MSTPTRNRTGTRNLVVLAIALIAVLVAVALLTTSSPDDGNDQRDTGPVVGAPALSTFGGDPSTDTERGRLAPSAVGTDFDGDLVEVTGTDRPTAAIFVAHWCPHCQAEVPVVQGMVDAGQWPDDVRIVTVVTGTSPTRPNYPPREWLAREGWTSPVIVDSEDSRLAAAYGLPAYPYWVFLNADDTIALRITGELTPEQVLSVLGTLDREGARPAG